MQTFIDQLPALIGVVIGALGTFWVTSATDRIRWRREQLTRWDERRLEAYAWESVLLLGDAATIEAARIWRNAVMRVALLARDQDEADSDWEHSISSAIDEVNEARDGFYVCARECLDVAGAAQAQAAWLRAESIRSGHDHPAQGRTAQTTEVKAGFQDPA